MINNCKSVKAKLSALDMEIRKCDKCSRREQCPDDLPTIQYKGRNDILFVVRDPAKNGWRKSGRAFFNVNGGLIPSGKIFDKQLKNIGISIEDINFVELIKCFPIEGKLRSSLKEEVENCSHWLKMQITIIKPTVIVPMGGPASGFFFHNQHGRKLKSLSDYISEQMMTLYEGILVIPIFHPSPAAQGKNHLNPSILKRIFSYTGVNSCRI